MECKEFQEYKYNHGFQGMLIDTGVKLYNEKMPNEEDFRNKNKKKWKKKKKNKLSQKRNKWYSKIWTSLCSLIFLHNERKKRDEKCKYVVNKIY